MADNTLLSAGTGGDLIRDKDRAGVKTQIMALDLNPAGAESLMAGWMPSRNYDLNTNRYQKVSTFGSGVADAMHGLVNTTFFTATSVTDNYTTANTGSATSTSNTTDGFFTLASGTTNPSTAQITSIDFATYNGISPLLFLNGIRAPQAGQAGCIRRWGAYDSTNGFFFEDNAGTFRVVTRKNSVDTAIASGSFNGNMGATYALDTNGHFFEIEITGGRSVFMIDQTLLHTMAMPAATTTQAATLNLRIRVEVISTGVTNMTLEGRGHNIARLGGVDSKRVMENIKDADDAELTKSILFGRSAADTYNALVVSATGAVKTDGSAVTQPVSGAFFQATQPVSNAGTFAVQSAATLSAETSKVIGTVNLQPSSLAVTGTAAVNTGVTVTLPAVAGQFHYITQIQIIKFYAALGVAAAAPIVATTTNLPGTMALSFGQSAAAQGIIEQQTITPTTPIKSSVVNTATTIVCPAQLQTIWRVNVFYYTAV